jgi:hypothetical protein
MSWDLGIGAAIKGVAGYFTQKQKRKADKEAAVAKREEILTNAAAQDTAVAGQIALANTHNQNNTWKDEYGLLVITSPVIGLMIVAGLEAFGIVPAGTTDRLASSVFGALSKVPEWWANTFQLAIWAAMGITGVKRIFK